jgi:hypothetical protein
MNYQKFWFNFFEEKAANEAKLNTYSVNGFVDKRQTMKIRSNLVDIIGKIRPHSLIDCGCGDGSVALSLLKYCQSLLGIEVSPAMANLAKNKGINVVTDSLWSALDANSNLNSYISSQKSILFLFCESLVCINNPNILIESIVAEFPNVNHFVISSSNKNSIFRRIFAAPATKKLNYLDFNKLENTMGLSGFQLREKILIIGIPGVFSRSVPFKHLRFKFLKIIGINLASNYIYQFSR